MCRFRPSLLLPRRHAALLVAWLLAAQLSLFAHAIGHDYVQDADQSHVVCGLCIAAHHLDHGLAPVSLELPRAARAVPGLRARPRADVLLDVAPFQARAPPLDSPS